MPQFFSSSVRRREAPAWLLVRTLNTKRSRTAVPRTAVPALSLNTSQLDTFPLINGTRRYVLHRFLANELGMTTLRLCHRSLNSPDSLSSRQPILFETRKLVHHILEIRWLVLR